MAKRAKAMMRLSSFIVCSTLLWSGAIAAEQERQATSLPEGSGKQLVVKYCAQCHELKRIEEDQGTEAEWVTRIRRMVRRGATVPTELIEPLGKYLAQALPPRVRTQSADSSPIATAVAEVAVRPIQVWVRVAAKLKSDKTTLVASVPSSEAERLIVGQRARAFAISARSSMYQGKVSRIIKTSSGANIEIELAARTQLANDSFVAEIITERSPVLSIPNEAIIEEGNRRLVYVDQAGSYAPRTIQTGTQGELHTEVLAGLQAGENVVTFGSFFIDAEFKLKSNRSADESGTLSIEYRGNPNPPREGDNVAEVAVKNPDGSPLDDAAVSVTYSMAAMPSMNMPTMRDEFTLSSQSDGKYSGPVRLSMAGTWQVKVAVTRNGKVLDSRTFNIIAK